MTKATTVTLNYVFEPQSDLDRLAFQFELLKSYHEGFFKKLLSTYGIADRIRAAFDKFSVLDAGCSEGLFLFFFYDTIREMYQGLEEKLNLVGFDLNRTAISTAESFAGARDIDAQFFLQNISGPYNPMLAAFDAAQFDFSFFIFSTEYLKNVGQAIKNNMTALNPGGFMYVYNLDLYRWRTTNEDVRVLWGALLQLIRNINPDVSISKSLTSWANDEGVRVLEQHDLHFRIGGSNEEEHKSMKNFVLAIQNARKGILANKILDAKEFDERWESLKSSLDLNKTIAQIVNTATLLQKQG